jgi:hypothetical protein
MLQIGRFPPGTFLINFPTVLAHNKALIGPFYELLRMTHFFMLISQIFSFLAAVDFGTEVAGEWLETLGWWSREMALHV